MRDGNTRGAPLDRLETWLVLALSGLFVLLGLLFLLAPEAGAALFGILAPDGPGLSYVVAIGLRDLAFGLYLFALSRLANRQAVGTVLGITTLIPVGDVVLVWSQRGFESPGHLILHGASAMVMMGASVFVLKHDIIKGRNNA
jgi:hypothetical protein